MPRFRSSLVLLLILLLGPMLAIAAEPTIEGIEIDGNSSDGSAWFAKTTLTNGKDPITIVYERESGQRDWLPTSAVYQRITELTHFGNQPVALLPDGQWLFVGESTGHPLPGDARIFALAGDASTLWALGDPVAVATPATTSPTTAASTQPAALTTRPATTQTTEPTELAVYQFAGGNWIRKAVLPRPISPARVALGLSASRPVVAFTDNDITTVLQLNATGAWTDLGQQPAEGQSPRQIITESGKLFVYLASEGSAGGPDRLLVRSDRWLDPVPLKNSTTLRSLGLTGGAIRYAYVDGQTIRQRNISTRTLLPEGEDEDILLPEPTSLQKIWGYLQWAMIGVVGLVVLHTYRQREDYRQLTPNWNKVQLAPFGRRIFAGLIDLMPMLIAAVYARLYVAHVETPPDLFNIPKAFNLLVWAAGIYLAHTTLIEAIAGRSLGKLVTRLQVVRLDGGKPAMGALAVRNLLRCVDLVLLFTPIFMFYLPLRQRIGDMAATTVVVADRDEDLVGPDA